MLRFLFSTLIFLPTLFADPVLFVDQADYEFGEQRSGTVVEHAFMLENRGTGTLKISDIKTSCGCTTSGESAMAIAAGEKKPLVVKIDLHGRSGPQTQHVRLSTNDPDRQTFNLKLSGEAVPDIRVEPRTLNLMQTDPDAPHEGILTLTSTNGKPFEVTSVTVNRDRVTASVEAAEDGLSAKIKVLPRPQEGQGHFTDVLEINTSNPDVQAVRVLVMWQVSTGVSVSPGQLNLVLSDTDLRLDRYLMVRGYPGLKEPLQVTSVEWPGQDVEIGFIDTEKFGWRIHLKSFRPQPGMKNTEILIHTNAEGFETLKIPVRVLEKK